MEHFHRDCYFKCLSYVFVQRISDRNIMMYLVKIYSTVLSKNTIYFYTISYIDSHYVFFLVKYSITHRFYGISRKKIELIKREQIFAYGTLLNCCCVSRTAYASQMTLFPDQTLFTIILLNYFCTFETYTRLFFRKMCFILCCFQN